MTVEKKKIEEIKNKINTELIGLHGTGSRQTRRWLLNEGYRYCPKCDDIKPLEDFYRDSIKNSGSDWRTYCKPCGLKDSIVWNKANYKSKAKRKDSND